MRCLPQYVQHGARRVCAFHGAIRGGLNRALRCSRVAMLYKSDPQAVVAFIHNRALGTDAPFIRT
jgi:hypothetical protein